MRPICQSRNDNIAVFHTWIYPIFFMMSPSRAYLTIFVIL